MQDKQRELQLRIEQQGCDCERCTEIEFEEDEAWENWRLGDLGPIELYDAQFTALGNLLCETHGEQEH